MMAKATPPKHARRRTFLENVLDTFSFASVRLLQIASLSAAMKKLRQEQQLTHHQRNRMAVDQQKQFDELREQVR